MLSITSERRECFTQAVYAGAGGDVWYMPMLRSRGNLWLAAILAAGVPLFLWKCGRFFNVDSLFYFFHRVESGSGIQRIFAGPDHLWQYRPLTFVIFSFLPNPLIGTNPLVGLVLLVGARLDGAVERFAVARRAWARFLIPAFAASCTAEAFRIAERSLRDLNRLRPVLPDGAVLYILDKSPASRGDLRWFSDYGSVFRLFYPPKSLVRFMEGGGRLPDKRELSDKAIILEFDGSALLEVPGRP